MKFLSQFLSIFLISIFLLLSCDKEVPPPQFTVSFSTLDEYFENNRAPEVFTVSSDQDISITGSQGTVLNISQFSIPAGLGDLTISFKEYLSRKDIILANLTTEATGDRLLESGGSFFLDIRDENGNETPPLLSTLTFPVPVTNSNPSGMGVWTVDDGLSEDFSEWVESPDSLEFGISYDLGIEAYTMFTPSFNWLNCDIVSNLTTPISKIRVSFPNNNVDWTNSALYVVGQNENTVSLFYQPVQTYFESIDYSIGDEVSIVVINLTDDGLFYTIEPITVTQDMHIDLNLTQTDEAGLEQALAIFD